MIRSTRLGLLTMALWAIQACGGNESKPDAESSNQGGSAGQAANEAGNEILTAGKAEPAEGGEAGEANPGVGGKLAEGGEAGEADPGVGGKLVEGGGQPGRGGSPGMGGGDPQGGVSLGGAPGNGGAKPGNGGSPPELGGAPSSGGMPPEAGSGNLGGIVELPPVELPEGCSISNQSQASTSCSLEYVCDSGTGMVVTCNETVAGPTSCECTDYRSYQGEVDGSGGDTGDGAAPLPFWAPAPPTHTFELTGVEATESCGYVAAVCAGSVEPPLEEPICSPASVLILDTQLCTATTECAQAGEVVQGATITETKLGYADCAMESASNWLCSCSDGYRSTRSFNLYADLTPGETCSSAQKVCNSEASDIPSGEPVCELTSQSVATTGCNSQNTCIAEASIDGISIETRSYLYTNCSTSTEGFWSCSCTYTYTDAFPSFEQALGEDDGDTCNAATARCQELMLGTGGA